MPEFSNIDRRRFNQLTAAALGGMITGSLAGCSGSGGESTESAAKHACRGLNDCKGQGADSKNACRGQGTCATYAHHSCAEKNECKGQGGCGETAGKNECKGQGSCEMPLMDPVWEQLRGEMVLIWRRDEKEFGEAPPKAKK